MEKDLDIESRRIVGGHVTFAQAHQDLFVRKMLNFKRQGFYLEIGAGEPKQSNNTYILESELGWNGFSLDIDSKIVEDYNLARKNLALKQDATNFDYASEFRKRSFPKQIDYLSLDIDPAEITYQALLKLPHTEYRFSIITYEHDNYLSGSEWMNKSRAFWLELGYIRVVSNVKCRERDFEDWYVDPYVISEEIYKPFVAENIECAEIFVSK
ncbi:MAG: hypothetical protein HS129_07045 [Leptospiraceae bacterium]|nr:hypothetical protein [Leptospiraceae bacterium]